MTPLYFLPLTTTSPLRPASTPRMLFSRLRHEEVGLGQRRDLARHALAFRLVTHEAGLHIHPFALLDLDLLGQGRRSWDCL